VVNPDLGVVEGNVVAKECGTRCPHLVGDKPGEYSCAVHDRDWYKDTPCFAHDQIGKEEDPCRIGKYILKVKT
jgi:hypothetical protein